MEQAEQADRTGSWIAISNIKLGQPRYITQIWDKLKTAPIQQRYISDVFDKQNVYGTEILSASIRYVNSVSQSFANGADIVTMPPAVFEKMYNHVLTDKGLQLFDEDWKNVISKV